MKNIIGGLRAIPLSLVAACMTVAMTSATYAQSALVQNAPTGDVTVMDQATLISQLRALGHPRHGGISRAITESNDARNSALPHFSGSFSAHGHTYPYTMLGYTPSPARPPCCGRHRSVRMYFHGWRHAYRWCSTDAGRRTSSVPDLQDAAFADGVERGRHAAAGLSEFLDAPSWHVRLETPVVVDPVDVSVDRTLGSLTRVGNTYRGNASGGLVEAEMSTVIQTLGLQPNQLAIFVTGNVSADALGWHEAYAEQNPRGGQNLYTVIYTSWFDVSMVGPLLADISTLNNEIGE
jgi:hypothetical protein